MPRLSLLLAAAFAASLLVPGAASARGGHGGGHPIYGAGHLSGLGSNPSSHHVTGYERGDGRYVAPHWQTNPNGSWRDNYEASGNVNPWTGSVGRRTAP